MSETDRRRAEILGSNRTADKKGEQTALLFFVKNSSSEPQNSACQISLRFFTPLTVC